MGKALHREVWQLREAFKHRINLAMRAIGEDRMCDYNYTLKNRCNDIGADYHNTRRILYSRNPTIEKLVLLSEIVGVELEWLMFGEATFDSIGWVDGEIPAAPEGECIALVPEEELKKRPA